MEDFNNYFSVSDVKMTIRTLRTDIFVLVAIIVFSGIMSITINEPTFAMIMIIFMMIIALITFRKIEYVWKGHRGLKKAEKTGSIFVQID